MHWLSAPQPSTIGRSRVPSSQGGSNHRRKGEFPEAINILENGTLFGYI